MIGQVAEDLSLLMRHELDLTKAEVKQEITKADKAAGLDRDRCPGVVGALLFAVGRGRMKQVQPETEADRRDGQGTAGRAQGSCEELNMTSGPGQIRSNIEQRARAARQYGPVSRMIACMSAQWAGYR